MKALVAGLSEKHTRATNQDRIFPSAEELPRCAALPQVFAVADGMGGTEDGSRAAAMAVEMLHDLPLQGDLTYAIEAYFQDANTRIVQEAGQAQVMGTTLSLLALTRQQIWIGHAGDSRVYLFRRGQLHPLTQDDNAFAANLRKGHIPFLPSQLSLDPEDREYLQEHKLYQVEFFYGLGAQEEAPDGDPLVYVSEKLRGQFHDQHQLGKIYPVGRSRDRLELALGKAIPLPSHHSTPAWPEELEPAPQVGDLFLLCSDGLCGVLEDSQLYPRLQQIARRLPTHPDPSLLHWGCELLFEDACDASSHDNISLLLVQVLSGDARAHEGDDPDDEPFPDLPTMRDHSPPATPAPPPRPKAPATPAPTPSESGADLQAPDPAPPLPQAPNHDAPPHIEWAQNPRLLWGCIASLLVALLASSLWPSSPPPPAKKSPHSYPPKPAGETLLFLHRMPPTSPPLRKRFQWLHQLQSIHAELRDVWRISTDALHPLEQLLSGKALSYPSLLRASRGASAHPSLDRALHQATLATYLALAPSYQRYLDEMEDAPSLPSATPLPPFTKALLLRRRGQLLAQITRHAPRSWTRSLIQERFLSHPSPALFRTTRHRSFGLLKGKLNACIDHLQRSHSLLQRQNPSHPLLAKLRDRIKLHRAHLQRLRKWLPRPSLKKRPRKRKLRRRRRRK